MSRKGKKSIIVNDGVNVQLSSGNVVVKGPKGELTTAIREDFDIHQEENLLTVINKSSKKDASAFHGLYQSLISNMIIGVTDGFKIELELFGVGYRAQKKGNGLQLALGYSHPVIVDAVEGINIDLEGQNKITVNGIDKQKVGQVASEIVKLRDAKKDPYKQKGVRYVGAKLRKKAGKKIK